MQLVSSSVEMEYASLVHDHEFTYGLLREGTLMLRRSMIALTALVTLGVACDSNRDPSGPADFPVQFQISNNLIAPVTVAIDGAPYVVLRPGASIPLTVSSAAQWLSWESANPMDAAGQQIFDDIGEVRIALGGINRTVDINNVIADQPYVTARIFNLTPAAVSIGVFDGLSVSCAAALPASSSTVTAFTQIGYYKLLATTELRAYRDAIGCTGAYSVWPSTQIRAFAAKSGLLLLTLDSPP